MSILFLQYAYLSLTRHASGVKTELRTLSFGRAGKLSGAREQLSFQKTMSQMRSCFYFLALLAAGSAMASEY
ncbi:MAG TPA: hypothetical protein VGS58_18475, partial [Candidatus Sulfopaludibacter sp.]|nr:hypothetical protein [Candidatus Sulfopaludibacter sp.]